MSVLQISDYDANKWKTLAEDAASRIETRLFIDGDYVDSIEGGRFETVNPTNGEVIAEMESFGFELIDEVDVDGLTQNYVLLFRRR